MKKVLVIAAHPDDEVLGCGGTMAKLVADGCEVNVLIVTDGSSSQYAGSDNLQQIIDDKKMIDIYNSCNNNYEKLQIYRIINDGKPISVLKEYDEVNRQVTKEINN